MVILNPGIAGKAIPIGFRVIVCQIVISHHDNRLAIRKQRLRVETVVNVELQIMHIRLVILFYRLSKLLLRFYKHPSTGNATILETNLFGPGFDLLRGKRWCWHVQKVRRSNLSGILMPVTPGTFRRTTLILPRTSISLFNSLKTNSVKKELVLSTGSKAKYSKESFFP